MYFQITSHGLNTLATALTSGSQVEVLYFRPFLSTINSYVDAPIQVSGPPVVLNNNQATFTLSLGTAQGNYLLDSFDLFTSLSDANNVTPATRDSYAFACSWISGSSQYIAINPPVEKFSTTSPTPNTITVQAELACNNATPTLSFTVINSSITAALEVSSVDYLPKASSVVPGTTLGSNVYLCDYDSIDGRILAKLSESLGVWAFDSFTATSSPYPCQSATTTSVSIGAAIYAFGSQAIANNFIIQFVTGAQAGLPRKLNSANFAGGSVTWATALPGAPAAGDQFIIYQSDVSILYGDRSLIQNIETQAIYTVPTVDALPPAGTAVAGLGASGLSVIPLLVLIGDSTSSQLAGTDYFSDRILAKNSYLNQTPIWSFDNFKTNALGLLSAGTGSTTTVVNAASTLNLAILELTFALDGTSQDDFILQFTSGANKGLCRRIVSAVGGLGASSVTLSSALPAAPASGDFFIILVSLNSVVRQAQNSIIQHTLANATPSSGGSQITTAGGSVNGRVLIDEFNCPSLSASWTVPYGITQVWLTVSGGGAGGNAGLSSTNSGSDSWPSCGGGAGQLIQRFPISVQGGTLNVDLTVSGADVLNITLGAGGLGGTLNGNNQYGGGTIGTTSYGGSSPYQSFLLGSQGGLTTVAKNGTTVIQSQGGRPSQYNLPSPGVGQIITGASGFYGSDGGKSIFHVGGFGDRVLSTAVLLLSGSTNPPFQGAAPWVTNGWQQVYPNFVPIAANSPWGDNIFTTYSGINIGPGSATLELQNGYLGSGGGGGTGISTALVTSYLPSSGSASTPSVAQNTQLYSTPGGNGGAGFVLIEW